MKKFTSISTVTLITACTALFGSCKGDSDDPEIPTITPPSNVTVEAGYDSARVTWDETDGAAEYTVELRHGPDETVEQKSTETATVFSGLKPESAYSVRVMASAENPARNSEYGAWVDFVTSPETATCAKFSAEASTVAAIR